MNDLINAAATAFGPLVDSADLKSGKIDEAALAAAGECCLKSMRWRASALVKAGLLPKGRRGRNGGPAEIMPEDAALFLISTAISLSGGVDIHTGVRRAADLMSNATKSKSVSKIPAQDVVVEGFDGFPISDARISPGDGPLFNKITHTFRGALAYFLKNDPWALRWVKVEVDRPCASLCFAIPDSDLDERLILLSYGPDEPAPPLPVVREVQIPQHTLSWFSTHLFGEPDWATAGSAAELELATGGQA